MMRLGAGDVGLSGGTARFLGSDFSQGGFGLAGIGEFCRVLGLGLGLGFGVYLHPEFAGRPPVLDDRSCSPTKSPCPCLTS